MAHTSLVARTQLVPDRAGQRGRCRVCSKWLGAAHGASSAGRREGSCRAPGADDGPGRAVSSRGHQGRWEGEKRKSSFEEQERKVKRCYHVAKSDPLIKARGSITLAAFLGGQGAAGRVSRKGGLAQLGVTSRFRRERAHQSSCENKAAGRDRFCAKQDEIQPRKFKLICEHND